MNASVMYDIELGEWYVSIYDSVNYSNSQQFFGYETKAQAEEDMPLLVAKLQARRWK